MQHVLKKEITNSIDRYKFIKRKKRLVLYALSFLLIKLSISALFIGTYDITFLEMLTALFKTSEEQAHVLLMWNMRLPRVVVAVVAGAGLSISGAIMQTTLNNDLASPSTLGITSAATFGANLSIIFIGSTVLMQMPYITTLTAFLCSMIAVSLILGLSKLKTFTPGVIILAGVAMSSLFQAMTTILQYFSDQNTLSQAVFWTFGDLSRANWQDIIILTVTVILSYVFFYIKRHDYEGLSHGELYAASIGIKTQKLRLISILVASLLTSVCVSFLGMIGFIGLIGPHIMKKMIGKDHRLFIPGSALLGSIILLFADMISRTIIAPITLPIGAITSCLGAGLFLYILLKKKESSSC